jgi:hypothetical protein
MDPVQTFRILCEQADRRLQDEGLLIGNGGDARSDWREFARRLGNDFYDDVRARKLAELLITEPPRRRMNQGGHAAWGPPSAPISDVKALIIRGVRQVRNNLGHGNKPDLDGRDLRLITEAEAVLRLGIERMGWS